MILLMNGTKALTYISLKADNYQFTKDNIAVYNLNEVADARIIEDGSLEIIINSELITGAEEIKFSSDAPFLASKILKKESKDSTPSIKLQDYLVAIIIVLTAIIYLIVDSYRVVYEYKQRRKKICTWQTR